MSDRSARLILGLAVFLLFAVVGRLELPALSNGGFWSDGSSYTSMALSLAEDGDLRYEARDVLRIRREFKDGPQGIFLKRSFGGFTTDGVDGFPWFRRVEQKEGRVYFAKAAAYPIAAAPLVKVFGTRGLLLTNALWLAVALVFGYVEARRHASPGRALALTLAVFLGGVTPLYLLWPQPEIFNVGVIMLGLWAWRADRPWLSAVLFGIATYSKPTHVFLALPLGVAPLLARTLPDFWRGLLVSVKRGLVLGVVTLSFYGANILVTGEWNYQGGERKTFYGPVFPFEGPGVTFGNSGFWMTTNTVGPRVEGEEETLSRGEVAVTEGELRGAFVRNLGYFWFGRYAGALLYFPAVVLAALAFLLRGPRASAGWFALASLVASWLFYIRLIPANWYGGGGTLGNRYFLSLVPLAIYLAPRGREWGISIAGTLLAIWALWPVALSPMLHTLHPGWHAMRAPFTLLPAELTMLNDLSFNTEAWRKKQSIGDTEGDAWRGWPADPKSFWLYFPDDGTWGKEILSVGEPGEGIEGFWLRGAHSAEVLLRALEPVRKLTLRLHGGSLGDSVEARVGGESVRLEAPAGAVAERVFEPGAGFLYYESFVHVLRFRSSRGAVLKGEAPAADGPRLRGAFVEIALEVDRRPRK